MNLLLLDVPEQIETNRFLLRVPKAHDGEKVYEALMDGYEDTAKWLNWSAEVPTKDSVEVECRQQHAQFILRQDIRYLIIDKESGVIVGRCALPSSQAVWSIPQFGLGYFVRASRRGQGVATEASHALTLLAFNILQAKKVEICADAENEASRRVPEKLNFKLEYQKKGGWPRQDGQLANLLVFSLFSPMDLPQNFLFKAS